jgi:hypothetical protein
MQLVLKGEKLYEELDVEQQDELWRPEFASYMLEGILKKSAVFIDRDRPGQN